jgi:hypothetical protein
MEVALYDTKEVVRLRNGRNAAMEVALYDTKEVVRLRKRIKVAWKSEQNIERLRARAVRLCEEDLARAHRMLEQARATPDKKELREALSRALSTAGRDTLCAMVVHAAAQEGANMNKRAEAEAEEKRLLAVAAKEGLAETVRVLLEAGAEVDHAANNGTTALYVAAQVSSSIFFWPRDCVFGCEVNPVRSPAVAQVSLVLF